MRGSSRWKVESGGAVAAVFRLDFCFLADVEMQDLSEHKERQ